MTRRYYSPERIQGPQTSLEGAEAHHLLHVLRARPGMAVTLFDGSGREFDAVVESCGRSTVELTVGDGRDVDRELPFRLVLGVALPKGDRQRWIVEKAVELGVTQLAPLVTEHGVAAGEKNAAEKLARYVIEASKQCGRNRLMAIAEPQHWSDWLAAADGESAGRRWVAHPGGRAIRPEELTTPLASWLAIGPEGGLSEAEVAEAAEAGWEAVGLGPRILRIETAAIALLAALTVGAAAGN